MRKYWIKRDHCNSKGYTDNFIKCPKCYGRGFVPEEVTEVSCEVKK